MGTTVGLLYPGHAAEDDYPVLERVLGADLALPVVHTAMPTDAHRLDALLEIGGAGHLAVGAELLRAAEVDAVVWACTSGSFVFGWDGARRQAQELTEVLGVPASSTSFAFVEAARALGISTVAVVATYPDDIAELFAGFLGRGGLRVVRLSAGGIVTAAEVGQLSDRQVGEFVVGGDHPDAEAVLVPDTALRTGALVDDLEEAVGKPVLTANQVSTWVGLRLAGDRRIVPTGAGTLFRDHGRGQ